MQQKDALFNWLQIKIVWEARPSDVSAKDTVEFFQTMLKEDHEVTAIEMKKQDHAYHVSYHQKGEEYTISFPGELAEKLLKDITEEPKYNQCL
ncbi:hypothetical protein MK805_03415 [Shimazuella sp. AN120528]|uniref:hypothetical protein n=1 Tax=Shimazuella soli TaxID=1892854 RepID=UPI001F0F1AB1|nr:hypothetical protein [Shimazuella soli]MCH5584012.1 hypothetical protein [Shimazuella soli]